LVFTRHKQKRKSAKGGSKSRGAMEGNRYVATLTEKKYPFPVDLQGKMWTEPNDLFWYPEPKEAFELLLNNASDQVWMKFLYALAKGTDLEIPQQEQGAELEAEAQAEPEDKGLPFTPPAEAAPREVPASGYSEDTAAPVEAASVDETVAAPLGLGADFGKRDAGEAQTTERERNTDDIAPPNNMPVPEPSKVFGEDATAAADLPESVEARTAAAKERLARMRGESGK